MTMQNNIDVIRRILWRNMDQPKPQTSASEIDYNRPVFVPIAVPADNGERRANCFKIERDGRLTNVAQMPNLVGIGRHTKEFFRQFVVRIRQNENALHNIRSFNRPHLTPLPKGEEVAKRQVRVNQNYLRRSKHSDCFVNIAP